MITYQLRSKFKKTMKIPEAIQQNIDIKDENDVYWYVHVVNNKLIISISLNQRVNIPNTVYHATRTYNRKINRIIFPDDIIELLKLEGQVIQWNANTNAPHITIITHKPIHFHENRLNQIIKDKITVYKNYYHGIAIPVQIHNLKQLNNNQQVFCSLYKYGNDNIFIVNNPHEQIRDNDYDLNLVFPAEIKDYNGQKRLILDESLKKYLDLSDDEEINWKNFYHEGEIIIAFTRNYTKKGRDDRVQIQIFKECEDYYIKIPVEVLDLLKLRNKNKILWKRYKREKICKINITADEPRYYKHRKTGKIIENTHLRKEITVIPKHILKHLKINKNTKVNWKLNAENKRYKYVELIFT